MQCLSDPEAIERWVKNDDHFYFSHLKEGRHLLPVEDFETCETCLDERTKALLNAQDLHNVNDKLRGLELFSGKLNTYLYIWSDSTSLMVFEGAGGLGTGMELSGFVHNIGAVEFSPSAAKTYQ